MLWVTERAQSLGHPTVNLFERSTMPRKHITLEERFWSKVNKDGPTLPGMNSPCWLWTGARSSDGYGNMGIDRRNYGAHRVSAHLALGLPLRGDGGRGPMVLHSCDNPPCVNPAHLRVGTAAENNQDTRDRGRVRLDPPRGIDHCFAKLTPEIIASARVAWGGGATLKELAAEYGVNTISLYNALTGKTWKHVYVPVVFTVHRSGLRRAAVS